MVGWLPEIVSIGSQLYRQGDHCSGCIGSRQVGTASFPKMDGEWLSGYVPSDQLGQKPGS